MSKYDALSRDQAVALLAKRDAQARLGLVWERDDIQRDLALNSDFVIMDPIPSLSSGKKAAGNLIIEGDNFDTLRWLRMTNQGGIKCIYIDPPYNTGKRDFVYNDRFIAKDDRYRHSTWLEWLYRRLTIARDLLSEDGLMFVSIDDHEFARIKLLLDEVFGEDSFMASLIWETDGNMDNQAKFKISHEYILVYSKDPSLVPAPPVMDPGVAVDSKLHNAEIRNTIVKNGPKNPQSAIKLPAGFPALFEEGIIPKRKDGWPKYSTALTIADFKLTAPASASSGWANKALCEKFIAGGFEPIVDRKGQLTRFALTQTGAIENIKVRAEQQSHVTSVIRNVGNVQSSAEHLRTMGLRFSFPKPVGLIQYLISMVTGTDFIVLDFFAGSGTTAEAVLRLNLKDGGNRKFIVASSTESTVEEPDKNICRDSCALRVKAVIKDVQKDGLSSGFNYLRSATLAFEDISYDLEPAQVWIAIQNIHRLPIATHDKKTALQVSSGAESIVAYCDKVDAASIAALAALPSEKALSLYCHTPGKLREELRKRKNVEIKLIPDELVRRFTA